jgi:hypothetical protein
MYGQIDDMMWARRRTEKLTIQHVGNPGEWPVCKARESKGPPDTLKGHSLLNLFMFSDQGNVVIIEKLMMVNISIGKKNDQNNGKRDNRFKDNGFPFEFFQAHENLP